LHWGEADWGTLYICATSGLYSLRTKTKAKNEAFMAPRAASPQASAPPPAPAVGKPDLLLKDRIARIEPSKTALILQDLQNDVIIDGGAFASSGSPDHARQQNVVANAQQLANLARSRGVMVIHVWMVLEPGAPYLAQHAALMQGLRSENALVRDTWGVAPVEGLAPQEGDLIVEKMSMSAWETSRLESYLRHGGRDTIINCGAWTNMSVEHTARTGADKGFHMIVPEDACSTMNADWHRASINYAMQNVATVSSTAGVLAALGVT
ncbi:MAG: cysteine hydrolase, partial [Pseudomonadota bacterium]